LTRLFELFHVEALTLKARGVGKLKGIGFQARFGGAESRSRSGEKGVGLELDEVLFQFQNIGPQQAREIRGLFFELGGAGLKRVRQLLDMAFDPAESALFKGSIGRMQTALFLASIASFESGYDVRIDRGHCEAMPGGIAAGWCDFGRSSSIMQVMTSGGVSSSLARSP